MSTSINRFINQLVKKIDKPEGVVPEIKIHITDHAYRWYFVLNNSVKISLHIALESITSLEIQYQRKVALGAFKHIEFIKITDGPSLMGSQGVTPHSAEILVALQQLEAIVFNVPWWAGMKREIILAWSSNKAFCGVKRDQPDRLFDAMKFIERVVLSPEAESLPDIRTLSALLYGNSKKLENRSFSNLIRKIMLPHVDQDIVDLVEDGPKLLEYLGVSKYPVPMRFKASGQLLCRNVIDLFALKYGIGVSPDEVKDIAWDQRPSYVLFIENRASFERYVREIDDSGVIIYTAGFPPRAWIRAIEIIIAKLRESVPIYHWGDRDIGGYRILAFLAKRLDTDIHPYFMGVEVPAQIKFDDKYEEKSVSDLMKALESARDYPAILALYKDLSKLSQISLPWIEQEQIAPISPLKPRIYSSSLL